MLRRTAIAVVFLFAVILTVAPSRADIGSQSVPVTVPADVPPISGPLPAPPIAALATPLPMPSPTAVPTIDPSFKVPSTILGQVFTMMLDHIFGGLKTYLDAAVNLGRDLYVKIAAISFILAVIVMFSLGELSLHRFVGLVYWRLLEMGIWLSIIRYTWVGPGGGMGWFSAIIFGFAQIGAKIAGVSAPGLDSTSSAGFTFGGDILPGTIADMGIGLFSAIMAVVSFGKGGLFQIGIGLLTGQTIASACLWIFGLFSAVYALAVCVMIALRFFWIFVKAFVLGTMSFIQGFAGSKRLSALAGSFLNASLVLGLEVCLTIILVGLPYHFIMGLIQTLGFGSVVNGVSILPPSELAGLLANTVMTAGALVVLNIVLSIWAYAVFRVPRDLAELFAGRINVSQQEITHAFQSSPLFGARMVGDAQGFAQTGAREGLGGMVKSGFSAATAPFAKLGQLSAMGMMAGGGAEEGGIAGATQGAVRGFALGGPEGAAVGAIAGAVMGGINQRKRQDDEEGGTISGDEAEGESAAQTQTRTASTATGDGGTISSATQDGNGASSSDDDGELAAVSKSRDVNVESNVHEAQADLGGADGGEAPDVAKRRRVQVDDDIVTRLNAAAAALQRGASVMEAAAAGGGGGGGKPPSRKSSGSNILDQLQTDMSTGDMLMRRFIYGSTRQAPPPGPVPDHESASTNIPVNIGPR